MSDLARIAAELRVKLRERYVDDRGGGLVMSAEAAQRLLIDALRAAERRGIESAAPIINALVAKCPTCKGEGHIERIAPGGGWIGLTDCPTCGDARMASRALAAPPADATGG
jgi:hypothetical protein